MDTCPDCEHRFAVLDHQRHSWGLHDIRHSCLDTLHQHACANVWLPSPDLLQHEHGQPQHAEDEECHRYELSKFLSGKRGEAGREALLTCQLNHPWEQSQGNHENHLQFAQSCEELVIFCYFFNKTCTTAVEMVLTDVGWCCQLDTGKLHLTVADQGPTMGAIQGGTCFNILFRYRSNRIVSPQKYL